MVGLDPISNNDVFWNVCVRFRKTDRTNNMETLFSKLNRQSFGTSPGHLRKPGARDLFANRFELLTVWALLLSFSLASWYWLIAGVWINLALLK